MGHHSVVEAKNQLSELIDRAMKGEDVVITRHGTPVVTLKPVRAPPRPMTEADIAWVEARRVRLKTPGLDAVALVRQMRDEDWDGRITEALNPK